MSVLIFSSDAQILVLWSDGQHDDALSTDDRHVIRRNTQRAASRLLYTRHYQGDHNKGGETGRRTATHRT
jgi:hypothetical protein